MIEKYTFDFLKGIAAHNDKEWFEDHRDDYERAKANLVDVAGRLIGAASRFDPKVANANAEPTKCVTRINRDMRFAKGKPPYKTDLFVMLNSVGDYQGSASYYLHVEPGGCYAGGGIFTTEPKALDHIRKRIAASVPKWTGVVESCEMRAMFPNGLTSPGELKRAPQGYDPDHLAIEYLRMKGFCANRKLTNKQLQDEDALDAVVETFKAAQPLVGYLNDAIAG